MNSEIGCTGGKSRSNLILPFMICFCLFVTENVLESANMVVNLFL